jgi:hypothetical protein
MQVRFGSRADKPGIEQGFDSAGVVRAWCGRGAAGAAPSP